MADVSIIISTNAKEASSEIGGLSASIAKSAAKANQMAKASLISPLIRVRLMQFNTLPL